MTNPKSFKELVSHIPEISACYQNGLQALGTNSIYVTVRENRELKGSVDLDLCSKIPNSKEFPKRWDYLFAYKEHILALEVHPAGSGTNISEVLAKASWLQNWLRNNGKSLSVRAPFYFIATGKVGLLNARQRGQLAQKSIRLCGKVLDVEKEIKFWK